MSHPLQVMIRALALRSWRLVFLWNTARCLALILLVGLLVGGVDYGLRIQDVGLRWMMAACFRVVCGGACWRLLLPAIRHRCSDIYIARHVENCFPDLGQRLSSSIAFLQLPTQVAGAGSATLRQAVIDSTSRELDELDINRCMQSAGTWRAVGLMLVMLLLVGACFVLDGTAASQAAGRLTRPWIHSPWPRWNHLQLVDPPPLKIATGASFRVRVKDLNERLPEQVVLQYVPLDDRDDQETMIMEQEGETALYRFNNVQRSFQFRVVGGDDDAMPWNYVTVIDPPVVEELQLEIHPPDYLHWPVEQVQESFRALQGSRVTLQGQLDRVVKQVVLVTEEENRRRRHALLLATDKRHFSLPADHDTDWILEHTGRYWIEAEDENGLVGVGQDQWEVRVVADMPPGVILESPEQQHQVLPTGLVSLEINARDDLGLQQLVLDFSRADEGQADRQTIVLWERDNEEVAVGVTGFLGPGPVSDRQAVTYRWDLARLPSLQLADGVEYRIRATDIKGQVSESAVGQLDLISRSELEREILRQQARIVTRLKNSLRSQRDTFQHAQEIGLQFQDPGTFQKSDLDHMQSVELNQRQVRQVLSDVPDSIPADVQHLLRMLRHNRVQLPELSRQLEQLTQRLVDIHQQHLESIESQLLAALKTARADREKALEDLPRDQVDTFQAPVHAEVRLAWQQVVREQQKVIQLLEELLGEISQQEDYRRFSHDLRRVADLQEQYIQQVQRLQVDRLGRTESQLTEPERQEQVQWGERQIELARQLETILGRMLQMQERLSQEDEDSAAILVDALALARQEALAGQMRESGRDIQRNQLGKAIRIESGVHDGLQRMLLILGNRHQYRLDRVLGELRKVTRQLEELGARQGDLGSQVQQASDEPQVAVRNKLFTQLAEKQGEIARQLQPLERALQQLGAEQAAQVIQGAGQKMKLAGQAMSQQQAADAEAGSREAEQKIAEAQQHLQRDMFQVKSDLLQEQLQKVKGELVDFLARQEQIMRETKSLDRLRNVDPDLKLTRIQRGVLDDLAEQQRLLARDALAAGKSLQQSEAFRFGIQVAGETMARAADALEGEKTGQVMVQEVQSSVVQQLKRLLEALGEKSAHDTNDAANSPVEGSGPLPGAARPRSLSELILLNLMQDDINRQTEALGKVRLTTGRWTPRQEEQVAELAKQQGQLAEIVERLRGAVPRQP
ncbi:MAG: hypothetical protein GY888_21720 [Planctomycetaceae bacterium]|nr:hypothetical protein [Planctomycetaceae bacterium]